MPSRVVKHGKRNMKPYTLHNSIVPVPYSQFANICIQDISHHVL